MQRYGGELIHHTRDEDGVLEIVEARGIRSLHFGTPPKQSAMDLQAPDRLELPYVRAMLSALAFVPSPRSVLMLGLGGGSLVKFLLQNFPDSRVEAVERRSGVPGVAHRFFGLPRCNRLSITVAEATAFVESRAHKSPGRYDLLLVDAYDQQGMDPGINAEDFFMACGALLRPTGVLSINLWGTHSASLRESTHLLRRVFPSRAFRLAVPSRGNVIGLGLGESFVKPNPRDFLDAARDLESTYDIEMQYFVRNLKPV